MNSNRRKLPACIIMSVALTGLVGQNTAIAASSSDSDVYVQGNDRSRLQTLLNQRGWGARFDGSGSLIVRRDVQKSVAHRQPPPSAFDRFTRALADRGWTTTRDADGNLLLWPRPPTLKKAPHTHLAKKSLRQTNPIQSQPPRGFVRFSQRLASLGWHTHFTRGGDLRLHPPGKQSTSHAFHRQAFKPRSYSGWDDLAHRLQRSGWLTQRTTDGSMKFWRPSFPSHSPFDRHKNPTGLVSPKSWSSRIPGSMLMPSRAYGHVDFRKSATDRGWSLSRTEDSSLLLVPFG